MMAQTWEEWRDAIWSSMERRFGHPGLAPLEQYMLRSKAEKRCVECGAAGTMRYDRPLIVQSVTHYWMCADCANYWERKA